MTYDLKIVEVGEVEISSLHGVKDKSAYFVSLL